MARLTLLDEIVRGSLLHRLEVEITQEILTVGGLIARRVHEEVAASTAHQIGVFQGLMQPTNSAHILGRR